MARSLVSRAWRTLTYEGPLSLSRAVRRRIYDRHKSVWYHLLLDENLKIMKPDFDGWLDFDNPRKVLDWIAARKIPGTGDPVEIARMQERGHQFVGVMDGERLIGYIKLGFDLVYVFDYGIDIQVPPGDFFVMDIYIGPEMRGRGAGPFLVTSASVEMRNRGFRRGVMHVHDHIDKTPMHRTCTRTGYRQIGRVDYRSIFGRKIFRPHPSTFFGTGVRE